MTNNKPPAGVASKGKPAAGKNTAKVPSIKFTATLGAGEIKANGMKLWLAIPESDVPKVLQLLGMRKPENYLEVMVKVKTRKIEKKKDEKKVIKRGVRRSRFGKY